MKNNLKSLICLLLAAFLSPVFLAANTSGSYYGLPGDDFSLEGALDLFKSCNTLEEFEHELNSNNNTVNNLDLNNNGRIDYLRVVDHAEGDLHAIVIQALIDQGISQDVAVIEVKRNRYGDAVVQIVGDEDLYGMAKIVEPYPYDDVVGTDYYDNYYNHYRPTVYVNAWTWPSVRFIFAPRYVVWVSPYYYNYYPVWYNTWDPYPYHVWHTRTVVYTRHYCVAPNYRIPDAHHYYGARRVSAPVVRQRTETYVAQHGGRSNFDYSKRNNTVEAPRSRSLDRSDKPTVANRTEERQRVQRPTAKPQTVRPEQTKPQAKNRSLERSQQPVAATPNTKQREQSPVAKPQVTRPQPKAVNPSVSNRRQEPTPSKPKVESNNRQVTPPTREVSPRSNNAVSNQNRSTKSSVKTQAQTKAQTRTNQKPATTAPKANRTTTNSRTSNGSSSKSSTKTTSSQPRKGKG